MTERPGKDAERPKDVADRLKQVLLGMEKPGYPAWFMEEMKRNHRNAWEDLFTSALNEIEGLRIMQDSYSRLYKMIYGSHPLGGLQ
jgi:hypothetical protein